MIDIASRSLRMAAATASLALALAAAPQASQAQTSTQPQASGAATAQSHARRSPLDRVEGQVKSFHDKLKITPDQETQWQAVAQAMRDNAKNMDALITKESQTPRAQRSAVDQLRVHQEFAQAHVDGLKAFAPPFEALYNVLTDSQKKAADTLFQRRGERGRHRHR